MGVGWVEIFWSIFSQTPQKSGHHLGWCNVFRGDNSKKNGKAFPGPKTGIVFPTCFSTLEKLGNQIVFPIFGICWRRIPSSNLVSQFQSPYFQGQVPGTLQKCGTPRLTSSGCLILWLMIGSGRYTLKISQIYLGFITIHERMEIRSRPTR